jgi:tetratricopeptide (TPR) repeat protein
MSYFMFLEPNRENLAIGSNVVIKWKAIMAAYPSDTIAKIELINNDTIIGTLPADLEINHDYISTEVLKMHWIAGALSGGKNTGTLAQLAEPGEYKLIMRCHKTNDIYAESNQFTLVNFYISQVNPISIDDRCALLKEGVMMVGGKICISWFMDKIVKSSPNLHFYLMRYDENGSYWTSALLKTLYMSEYSHEIPGVSSVPDGGILGSAFFFLVCDIPDFIVPGNGYTVKVEAFPVPIAKVDGNECSAESLSFSIGKIDFKQPTDFMTCWCREYSHYISWNSSFEPKTEQFYVELDLFKGSDKKICSFGKVLLTQSYLVSANLTLNMDDDYFFCLSLYAVINNDAFLVAKFKSNFIFFFPFRIYLSHQQDWAYKNQYNEDGETKKFVGWTSHKIGKNHSNFSQQVKPESNELVVGHENFYYEGEGGWPGWPEIIDSWAYRGFIMIDTGQLMKPKFLGIPYELTIDLERISTYFGDTDYVHRWSAANHISICLCNWIDQEGPDNYLADFIGESSLDTMQRADYTSEEGQPDKYIRIYVTDYDKEFASTATNKLIFMLKGTPEFLLEFPDCLCSIYKVTQVVASLFEPPSYDAQAWYNQGVYFQDKRNYAEAIKAFDKATKIIEPQYIDIWCEKGIALQKQLKYTEAIKAFDKAINIGPHYAKAWYNKGLALDKLGKYNEAIQAIDKAIELYPQYGEAWYQRGIELKRLGRNIEAEADFSKAKWLGHTSLS